MRRSISVLATALACAIGLAQTPIPLEFPPNATSVSADQLKARLTDRVYGARMSDGKDWRYEWKSNGYAFINISNGYSDSGKWRVEDGKICVELTKTGSSCSDVRLLGDVLYLKRASNGEVIELKPK